jgi:methylenetetrahydrofolate--tRNA-(uracil-5-)-methyltransferase
MHRNTFLPSPEKNPQSRHRSAGRKRSILLGQMTGVEGYVESASSGLVAGIQAALDFFGMEEDDRRSYLPGPGTVMGSLAHYIARPMPGISSR